jgi:hypothetical protein
MSNYRHHSDVVNDVFSIGEEVLEEHATECHACYGTGQDRKLDADCLECWGEGSILVSDT